MSIVVGVGVPGLAGSNVTCCPLLSTAVHWVADGHAIPSRPLASIAVGVGVPGLAGSNVTCCPLKSKAVHWVADGHATPPKAWWPLSSIAAGFDHDSCASEAAGSQHATAHNATSTTSSRRTATGPPSDQSHPEPARSSIPALPFFRYPTDPGPRLRKPITSTNTHPHNA